MCRMEKFLTTEEAAEELGVTPARARQLIRAGILKAKQFGRAYVVTPAAITEARKRHSKPGPVPKASGVRKELTSHHTASDDRSTRAIMQPKSKKKGGKR